MKKRIKYKYATPRQAVLAKRLQKSYTAFIDANLAYNMALNSDAKAYTFSIEFNNKKAAKK